TVWSSAGRDFTSLYVFTTNDTTPATSAAGVQTCALQTSLKDTTIAVSTDTVTDPVNQSNQTSVSASGTTDSNSNTVKVSIHDAEIGRASCRERARVSVDVVWFLGK